LGFLFVFSLGMIWLAGAMLFVIAIVLDSGDRPRFTGRGLVLQAFGFGIVLASSFLFW